MYQNSIIELVGGKNAGTYLSGGWVKVSAEQIIKWDPDIILLAQYCDVKPIDVLNNKSLQGVKAVKNKYIYFLQKFVLGIFLRPKQFLESNGYL